MPDTTSSEDAYILRRTAEETERLRAQSRLCEPLTVRTLERAGLGVGMRALDVGCGPGEVMRLMGGMVGPEGEVIGLDLDAALGARAAAELNAAGRSRYRFEAADITGDAGVAGAPFDLVFARFLLIHMTDPVAIVRRMARLARPGGKLVLMDFDLSRLAVRPEHSTIQRGFEIVAACFEASGKRADTGLALPELMLAAGLEPPEGVEVHPVYGPLALIGPMLRGVLDSLRDAARGLGVAGADEIADVAAACAAAEAAGRHYALGPSLYGVWTTVR